MKVRATNLYATAALHFGKRPAETALYGRRLGEARPSVGFPQGRPGPGGGIFITETRQAVLHLLGMAASATAGDAPAAVRAYAPLVSRRELLLGGLRRDLTAHVKYLGALGAEEANRRALEERLGRLAPVPLVFDFIRATTHTLVDALTMLIDEARVEDRRKRLRGTLVIMVWRTRPLATIEIDDQLAGERFRVIYAPDAEDCQAPERDAQITVTFTDWLIRDIGAVLGANSRSEHGDAPSDEADGAFSEAGHPRANASGNQSCDPRANAARPAPHTGQSSAAATRFPPPRAPGSPSSPDGLATGDSHGPSEPARPDPPAARHRREHRRESA